MTPTSVERGRYKIMAGVCLSIRPYVCLSCAQPNSRMERHREPKIGTMEAHHTGNPWTYLEVKRSKVNVTRLINAVTDNAPYAGQRHYNFLKICLFFSVLSKLLQIHSSDMSSVNLMLIWTIRLRIIRLQVDDDQSVNNQSIRWYLMSEKIKLLIWTTFVNSLTL